MELGFIRLITSIGSSVLILLHMPACDKHWADRLGLRFLKKYHKTTLRLAVGFALIHIILLILGWGFGIWV